MHAALFSMLPHPSKKLNPVLPTGLLVASLQKFFGFPSSFAFSIFGPLFRVPSPEGQSPDVRHRRKATVFPCIHKNATGWNRIWKTSQPLIRQPSSSAPTSVRMPPRSKSRTRPVPRNLGQGPQVRPHLCHPVRNGNINSIINATGVCMQTTCITPTPSCRPKFPRKAPSRSRRRKSSSL